MKNCFVEQNQVDLLIFQQEMLILTKIFMDVHYLFRPGLAVQVAFSTCTAAHSHHVEHHQMMVEPSILLTQEKLRKVTVKYLTVHSTNVKARMVVPFIFKQDNIHDIIISAIAHLMRTERIHQARVAAKVVLSTLKHHTVIYMDANCEYNSINQYR